MVGAVEVVVDGLGHAHHAALIAHLLHILGDLVAGVHGVVAAVVEEIADIVLLEDLENALVIGIIHIGIGHLVTAGAQRGRGSILQQLQLGGIFFAHIEQAVVQHALDAVLSAQHAGDIGIFQRGIDDTVHTGIDHGSRTAGLPDDACAFQLTHGKKPPQKMCWFSVGKLAYLSYH